MDVPTNTFVSEQSSQPETVGSVPPSSNGTRGNGLPPPESAPTPLGPLRTGRNSKHVTIKSPIKPGNGPVVDLLSRLYDTPGTSQVMKTYMSHGAASNGMQPRPPSGSRVAPSAGPGPAFRTTFFKRDHVRKQIKNKARMNREDSEDGRKLTLGQLTRQPSKEDIMSNVGSDMSTQDDDLISVTSEGDKADVKSVRFQSTPGQEHGLISQASRVPSSKGGSLKDPSVVLTYLKKNKYDDTEPENDRFIEWLHDTRSELGWVFELPHHGPGCKEEIDKLIDSPQHEDSYDVRKDTGSFVYCLPRNRNDPRGRYNPYDLQVVSANTARAEQEYYTNSASSITRNIKMDKTEDAVVIPVIEWLWERRLFNMVFEVPVFVKFRIWKAFSLWRISAKHNKKVNSITILTKRLFTANEYMQGCLLHVQGLCEAASGSLTGSGVGEAAISLMRVNKAVTLTLSEFIATQRLQCDIAWKQLNAMRNNVIETVWETCAKVAEMEGVTHGIRPEAEDKLKIQKSKPEKLVKYKIKTKFGEIFVYKKAQNVLKDRPSYAQISEWRKVLARLADFLKSVDYVLLEMLRRLVKTALKSLLYFIEDSFNVEWDDDEFDDDDDSDSGSTTTFSRPGSRARRWDQESVSSYGGSAKVRLKKKKVPTATLR